MTFNFEIRFAIFYSKTNRNFRSTDDSDRHENGMEEPAEDFSTFKKAVNESICHQKDQSNVDRNEMTSIYTRKFHYAPIYLRYI